MNLKKLLSLVAVATVSLSVVACEGQTEKKKTKKQLNRRKHQH